MEQVTTIKKLPLDAYIKELNPLFLNKREFQYQGIAINIYLFCYYFNVEITKPYAAPDLLSEKVCIF